MLIMGSVLALTRYGLSYIRDSEARLEAQQNVLFAMHRVQAELRESNIKTVRAQTNAMLFADPRNDQDYYRYDDKSRLYWHGFVLYSVEVQRGKNILVRRRLNLDPPVTVPPLPQNFPQADMSAMQSDRTLPNSIIGTGIETFTATVGTDSVEILLVAKSDSRSSTESYDDFTVEVRDKVLLVH